MGSKRTIFIRNRNGRRRTRDTRVHKKSSVINQTLKCVPVTISEEAILSHHMQISLQLTRLALMPAPDASDPTSPRGGVQLMLPSDQKVAQRDRSNNAPIAPALSCGCSSHVAYSNECHTFG